MKIRLAFSVVCSLVVMFATGCATSKYEAVKAIEALEAGEEIAIQTIELISISQQRGDIIHLTVQDANADRIRGSIKFLCCEPSTAEKAIAGKIVEVDLKVIETISVFSTYKTIRVQKKPRKLSSGEIVTTTINAAGTIIICIFTLGAGCQ